MKSQTSLLGCFLIFLVITIFPLAFADSIVKPTVVPPPDWYLCDQGAYGDYIGQYDPEGSGMLLFTDGVDFDLVRILYEKAPDYELTAAALETKATLIYSDYHAAYALDHTGTMSIAGVWAGYAVSYDSEFDSYILDLCLIKNGVFMYVYAFYHATNEDWNQVTALVDSISVEEPDHGLPWLLIIGPIIAVVIIVIVVVVFFMKRKKPEKKEPKPVKVRVTAEPSELLADGKTKSAITVELLDAAGNPVPAPDNTEIKLTTTKGKIEQPIVKISKGKEKEQTLLVSPKEGGKATLSANVGDLGSTSVTVTFLEKTRYCMHCGSKMSFAAKNCPVCGKSPPAGVDTQSCKKCNAVIPNVANFCAECGARQLK